MDQNEKIKRDKKGLLVLLLLLIAVISGTFAVTFSRYYSSTTGKAEASVAKWSVEITDKDMIQQKMEETATINLEECVWDNNASTAEENKFAPGSECTLTVVVTNKSEVAVDLSAEIGDIVDKGTQQVVTNSAITAEIDQTYSVMNLESVHTDNTGANRGGLLIRITWDPGNDDTVAGNATDTAMGIDAADLQLDVTITAKQHIN